MSFLLSGLLRCYSYVQVDSVGLVLSVDRRCFNGSRQLAQRRFGLSSRVDIDAHDTGLFFRVPSELIAIFSLFGSKQ